MFPSCWTVACERALYEGTGWLCRLVSARDRTALCRIRQASPPVPRVYGAAYFELGLVVCCVLHHYHVAAHGAHLAPNPPSSCARRPSTRATVSCRRTPTLQSCAPRTASPSSAPLPPPFAIWAPRGVFSCGEASMRLLWLLQRHLCTNSEPTTQMWCGGPLHLPAWYFLFPAAVVAWPMAA